MGISLYRLGAGYPSDCTSLFICPFGTLDSLSDLCGMISLARLY